MKTGLDLARGKVPTCPRVQRWLAPIAILLAVLPACGDGSGGQTVDSSASGGGTEPGAGGASPGGGAPGTGGVSSGGAGIGGAIGGGGAFGGSGGASGGSGGVSGGSGGAVAGSGGALETGGVSSGGVVGGSGGAVAGSGGEAAGAGGGTAVGGGAGAGGSGGTACDAVAADAYEGEPRTIPGVIEAEDFDPGGFTDSTPGNQGGAYRTDVDVDIKELDAGYAVGWMTAGERLDYTVNVTVEADYRVTLRGGAIEAGRTVELSDCEAPLTDPIPIPVVAAWGEVAEVTAGPVHLTAGLHVIRVTVGASDSLDLDSLSFEEGSAGTGGAGGTGGTGGAGGSAGAAGAPGTGGAAGYSPCPTSVDTPCAILPLGDSITEGFASSGGGYRVELFRQAVRNGRNITFVGSLQNGPSNPTVEGRTFPRQHEGHGGYTIDSDAGHSGISGAITNGALDNYHPHVVLLMIGTNDINGNVDVAGAPGRLGNLIDDITTRAPDTLVVVASIIPIDNAGTNQRVQAYNAAIPEQVSARAAAGAHVVFLDNYAAFAADPSYASTLMADYLHPNDAGYAVLGRSFYDALQAVLPASQALGMDAGSPGDLVDLTRLALAGPRASDAALGALAGPGHASMPVPGRAGRWGSPAWL